MKMKTLKHISILIILTSTIFSCGIYSFSGASIPAEAQTFQVNFFQNNAPIVEPGIDIQFTNTLRDLMLNQTNLSLVTSNGDLLYEGEIVNYRISPTNATADLTAAQNRLTIGVNVRYFNKFDTEKDFERSFSFFFDFDGGEQLIGGTLTAALEEIFERITQDIFNASLAQW